MGSHVRTPAAVNPPSGVFGPGHRRPFGVAALVVRPEADADRVAQVRLLDRPVGQADLVALVEEGRPPQA